MMVLVTYDVSTEDSAGEKRLRKVAKLCQNMGQRVQKSVFECLLEPQQWLRLRGQLMKAINIEKDSLRFYFLGSNWKGRIEHVGLNRAYDPDGPLIA
ncbi:CRISPR-associated endonuclease Cas2 [bacterium]|nr:CRISPR-associated endonuclease Cas2 [candidate division CSSED10-310 bacterium]